MSFKQFLAEMPYIGASKKAWAQLSWEAKDRIESWETSGWVGGPLEKSVMANDKIAQEIEAAFAPIRKMLGKSIRLYRGMQRKGEYEASHRLLESWTDNLKVAEHFAGLRSADFQTSHIKKEISDAEIAKAVKNYEIRGFAQALNYKFIKNKNFPQYFDIFKNNEYITDGEDIEEFLKDKQQMTLDANERLIKNAIILNENISTDRIVWITNNLNSKEFIVKRKK